MRSDLVVIAALFAAAAPSVPVWAHGGVPRAYGPLGGPAAPVGAWGNFGAALVERGQGVWVCEEAVGEVLTALRLDPDGALVAFTRDGTRRSTDGGCTYVPADLGLGPRTVAAVVDLGEDCDRCPDGAAVAAVTSSSDLANGVFVAGPDLARFTPWYVAPDGERLIAAARAGAGLRVVRCDADWTCDLADIAADGTAAPAAAPLPAAGLVVIPNASETDPVALVVSDGATATVMVADTRGDWSTVADVDDMVIAAAWVDGGLEVTTASGPSLAIDLAGRQLRVAGPGPCVDGSTDADGGESELRCGALSDHAPLWRGGTAVGGLDFATLRPRACAVEPEHECALVWDALAVQGVGAEAPPEIPERDAASGCAAARAPFGGVRASWGVIFALLVRGVLPRRRRRAVTT
ncbi:MAG: hypothetical protein H6700_08100 [Myxococcales bacterium]|nr:hypothetical protein [Myxococcales bacterium]MCB9531714.1 hypothetical protein [Myxococcales bacterium]